jgi:hypothetical protein
MRSDAAAPDVNAIAQALAAPFDAGEVKFKAQAVSGNRALAVPFVDARVVQDRLDDVLGVMGWQDAYEVLPDGAVVCSLKVRIGSEWIVKMDVGGQSEQPDEGDRRKAAFSDSLKRAAVKFGVGRYLYRSKPQWVDYDPAKRQFTGRPAPPPAAPARPGPAPQPRAEPPAAQADREQLERTAYEVKVWTDWLATGPDLEAFNETLQRDLPSCSEAVRRQAWMVVQGYAATKGWELNKAAKAFFDRAANGKAVAT